jgi:hypothetical protein
MHLVQRVDLSVLTLDLIYQYLYFRIFRLVLRILKYGRDAFPMESMKTREHVELPVEYSCVAYITTLARINCDVFVSLTSLLVSQLLGIVGVLFNFYS